MQHAQGRAPAARLPSKPSSTKSSRGRRAELSRHCPPVFRVSALHSAAALRAPIAQQWFCCPSSSEHPLAPWKPLKPLPLCSQPTSAHSWAELWRARTQSHRVLPQQIQGSREHTPVNRCKWKKGAIQLPQKSQQGRSCLSGTSGEKQRLDCRSPCLISAFTTLGGISTPHFSLGQPLSQEL